MNNLNHIAFIMDGNGRWANMRNKPRNFGHKKGAKVMEEVSSYGFSQGATVLSFYAFSTENWKRPKKEVNGIISLLMAMLVKNKSYLINNQIRLKVSGDINCLTDKQRSLVIDVMDKTATFTKTINICFNYGGRNEILRAVNNLIQKNVNWVDEADFEKELYSFDLPPIDLIIRTSGEQRLSNFMLWQSAYSEIYFTNTLWPDFTKSDLDDAINWFLHRKRRFGNLS